MATKDLDPYAFNEPSEDPADYVPAYMLDDSIRYVYHGSPDLLFDFNPTQNVRCNKDGTIKWFGNAIFATPYIWMAASFCNKKTMINNGKHYGKGIDLYDSDMYMSIYGHESLQQSLDQIYPKNTPGYIYVFRKEDFHWEVGLGTYEVVCKRPLKPVFIRTIDDVQDYLKEKGIKYKYYEYCENDEIIKKLMQEKRFITYKVGDQAFHVPV
jgi:hypothetical protein